MTQDQKIEKAASRLHEALSSEPNLNHVGIGLKDGKPSIHVGLVKNDKKIRDRLSSGWEGFPVEVKVVGRNVALSRQ